MKVSKWVLMLPVCRAESFLARKELVVLTITGPMVSYQSWSFRCSAGTWAKLILAIGSCRCIIVLKKVSCDRAVWAGLGCVVVRWAVSFSRSNEWMRPTSVEIMARSLMGAGIVRTWGVLGSVSDEMISPATMLPAASRRIGRV